MRKVSNRNLPLFLNGRKEGAFVVHFEGEDAVLVRGCESCAKCCAIKVGRGGDKRDAVEGRQHREFELEGIIGGDAEGCVSYPVVLRNFDFEFLEDFISLRRRYLLDPDIPHRS